MVKTPNNSLPEKRENNNLETEREREREREEHYGAVILCFNLIR